MPIIANQSILTRKEILAYFSYRCLLNPGHTAVCVHEIIPRSQRPKTWMEFKNRVTLCAECHDKIHHDGASNWVEILTRLRKEWIKKYVR